MTDSKLSPILILGVLFVAGNATSFAAGVLPDNPLYFTDGSKRAIYLAGHQSFVDLQNNALTRSRQRILDWDGYVEFLLAAWILPTNMICTRQAFK